MPLEGAGRVEDTINLLAHAAREVISAAASVLDRKAADIARAAGAPMLAESSIKKALDLEWSDPEQKAGAVMTVVEQLDALEAWVGKHMPAEAKVPPLSVLLATLRQLRDQDLEPDPSGVLNGQPMAASPVCTPMGPPYLQGHGARRTGRATGVKVP